MNDFARMIRRHFAEIVAYFEHPYTNAVLKGADSVIQNVKRRARGFRNMDYFATMVYLTCGKLDLKAVTTSPSVRVFLQIGPYPHLVTACIITIILIVIQ